MVQGRDLIAVVVREAFLSGLLATWLHSTVNVLCSGGAGLGFATTTASHIVCFHFCLIQSQPGVCVGISLWVGAAERDRLDLLENKSVVPFLQQFCWTLKVRAVKISGRFVVSRPVSLLKSHLVLKTCGVKEVKRVIKHRRTNLLLLSRFWNFLLWESKVLSVIAVSGDMSVAGLHLEYLPDLIWSTVCEEILCLELD